MKNFFKPITLKWWQVGVVKVALISFGILVGIVWSSFFEAWIPTLLALLIVSWAYLVAIWFRNWKD
ncbi:MAG: hypothetical protein COT89_00475 [Candidatus Colwellbacteria bacterium CG10_big_fil_rev_8_21_14_0_10_42_22]|uniref:Uncharacterized protein n=1 Tax=Candidatus Colwellbacteria bacterium CG10_big_fil_rev_8_21_14_0_10_42_22 TaxID=1974540 RepID=A0A2H0VGF9_9BACT|nr:MAG: hypothetical protein COT89_00475 [Candidatus Colwellbacteria bacterium CG10_big_fil_rev_8_21_14_0_10_42_22]